MATRHVDCAGCPVAPRRRPRCWHSWSLSSPARPRRDVAAYAAYCAALVRRYGPAGTFWAEHPSTPRLVIRAWQIWNEPNLPVYWTTQPFATGYVRLLKAARKAIKAVDRGSTIV